MSACSPHPSSSSGLPPYSCPLGQDPAATDFSRLNPLVRTSSTSKGSFARIDSLASQFSFRGGVGGKGGGDSELEELISLRLILAGKTKSPIGVMDLRGWLANRKRVARGEGDEEAGWLGDGEEGRRREDEGALEFLVAFERYRTDFFALDLEDQLLSPTPFQLISLLSLSSHSHNKSSSSSSRNNNEPLPPLPPLKAPTSFRLPVTPTSSAGASSNPSTPQSAFSSSSTPSSSKQPQPMVYSLPPVARSRSGSAPPPLTLVPEGLILAPRLPTVPDAVSFGDAASSDGRSVRSVASSKRTAGGLRGMGQRPLPRPHEEEESEEEDYDEDEPENRSRSRSGSSRPSTKTRLRGMSGTSSSSSNGGSTIRPTQSYPAVPSASRPRAATLPSSNASTSSSTSPFQDPLTSAFTTIPLSLLPPSPLSSVPPTPPPHDYDERLEATQPLREELNVLLSLAERLLKEFRVTDQMRREARMTTHPDVLSGLAGKVEEWAEREWLVGRGGFLEDALENLDHRTALGRLLCGSFLSILAIIAFFLLLLNPSPFRSDGKAAERPWRLIVVPMFLGGVGYAMGSRKSLCFWLALFGVREQKDYERSFELHPLAPPPNPSSTTTSRMNTSNSLSSRLARHGRQTSLSSVREVEIEELPSPSSERRVPPHPLDLTSNPNLSFHTTQTLSPSSTSFFSSTHSLAPTTSQRSLLSSKPKRARLPHLRRPSLPSSTRRTFWKLRLRLPKPPEIKIVWAPWFITLWRLTGTAWGTKRVEDERVLRAQRKAAWRIAGVLMAILAVLTVVVMVVPLIGKGRGGGGGSR